MANYLKRTKMLSIIAVYNFINIINQETVYDAQYTAQ